MPYGLVIVGGGPGGFAPLFAAASDGSLRALLAGGVLIIEKADSLGPGQLGQYCIQSDSPAEAFLDILARSAEPSLRALLSHPVAVEMASHRGDVAPLKLAAALQELAAYQLCALITSQPNCTILRRTEALRVDRDGHETWIVRTRHCDTGEELLHAARSVHIATGASQPVERLATDRVAGVALAPRFNRTLMQSGELFTASGRARLVALLSGKQNPRVTIIGGSTSAGSAAVLLLRRSDILFAPGGVTLLHRGPLRLFYGSEEEARNDGYTDFQASDVCHISGRVYRLGGFRSESKDIIRAALRINSREPDPRLQLARIGDPQVDVEALLEGSDLIVVATGYRPQTLPVFDEHGDAIVLHQPRSGAWAMVDQQCRLLTQNGTPLEGLTAMGLAIGPAASHELGGETNFKGQVNSLWLWQNQLGMRVCEGALRRSTQRLIPLMRPAPPALSRHVTELRAIEHSNIYSNYGPVARRFEHELIDSLFDGKGHAITVANATLALMLTIRNAVGTPSAQKRYALMPSFTFAAAAQAAMWCGLTPLFCDIHPETWLPCKSSEDKLLQEFAGRIAIIVPNATFGNNLDIARYERLEKETSIPVVVDAAACLGSIDRRGEPLGRNSTLPIVFSMHATKVFSTGEGGIIYSSNSEVIERLRSMASFGFGDNRIATTLGLNAKMSEVAALTASLQLRSLPHQLGERDFIAQEYGKRLNGILSTQHMCGRRQARSFESVLLPTKLSPHRNDIMAALQLQGITTGSYFSPHLAQQPFFSQHSAADALPVSDEISSRIITLPLYLGMSSEDISYVTDHLLEQVAGFSAEYAL